MVVLPIPGSTATWQHGDVAAFADGEEVWVRRLGNLRNTVRQDVISRQLAEHVRAPMTVLDVGCGQGTQAIALAAAGCAVTGVEPSASLRALCERSASEAGVGVELLDGSVDALPDLIGVRRFDVVCAHGLLMYLADRPAAIATLAACLADDGVLSVTFRNGHALAMRPALRGDWSGALAALEGDRYVNELGVEARADRLDDVTADLAAIGPTSARGTAFASSTTRSIRTHRHPTITACSRRCSTPSTRPAAATPTAGSVRSSTSSPDAAEDGRPSARRVSGRVAGLARTSMRPTRRD
jgi:S-adenosylmethionine-dependent methyltransferase